MTGLLEYDGFADCRCRITSATAANVKDIRLEVDVAPGADTYFMGLGKTGGKCPESVNWKWNANVNQDGFWIGAVNGGFKLQLYGANWRTPLINCYYHFRELMVPESWGTGGIRLSKSAAGTQGRGVQPARAISPRKSRSISTSGSSSRLSSRWTPNSSGPCATSTARMTRTTAISPASRRWEPTSSTSIKAGRRTRRSTIRISTNPCRC